jgi:hypothetical protein
MDRDNIHIYKPVLDAARKRLKESKVDHNHQTETSYHKAYNLTKHNRATKKIHFNLANLLIQPAATRVAQRILLHPASSDLETPLLTSLLLSINQLSSGSSCQLPP